MESPITIEDEALEKLAELSREDKIKVIAAVLGYKQFNSPFNKEQKVWALSQDDANTSKLGDWTWSLLYNGLRNFLLNI